MSSPSKKVAKSDADVAALRMQVARVCVFYYCRTYYKAVRVGGGGEWRTCAMRDDEPRPVWMSLPITHQSSDGDTPIQPTTKICSSG
jgi:hypothetical protein